MQFKINEKVVYPAHGVAVVEDVIEKVVGGNRLQFYKLSFLYKDMTILIPVNNCEQTGVRCLSTVKEIDNALSVFNEKVLQHRFSEVDVSPSAWNKRHKDYQNRMQGGDFSGVLAIYQELMYMAQHKDLSFGEKNLLHTTEELLGQELMVAKDIDRSASLEFLRSPFKQFVINYAPAQNQTNL
jgi:CarD family transcriptional regulator